MDIRGRPPLLIGAFGLRSQRGSIVDRIQLTWLRVTELMVVVGMNEGEIPGRDE